MPRSRDARAAAVRRSFFGRDIISHGAEVAGLVYESTSGMGANEQRHRSGSRPT